MLLTLLLTGWSSAEPAECQPKDGIHRHQPQFHVIAPMFPGANGTSWPGGVNDANAIFQHRGVFHMMHQCDGGPAGLPCGGGWEGRNPHPDKDEQTFFHSWGHVVSTDLARWRRVPDALTPSFKGYEHGSDCDGTVSFPAGLGPVALYGPGCGFSGGEGRGEGLPGRRRVRRDAARIGVAVAANASDPWLLGWVRSPNLPVTFAPGSPPCSFAGTVWKHNDTHWSLVCSGSGNPEEELESNAKVAGGGTRQRYTAPVTGGVNGIAGPWTLVDPAFGGAAAELGGGSGPVFYPLPPVPAPPGAPAPPLLPTHIISAGSGSTFGFGAFDPASERLVVLGETTLGGLHWTAGGLADDGRILLTGWIAAGNDPAAVADGCPLIAGIAVCGVQAEAAPRVVSFEPGTNMLLSYPAAELASLRNATLFNRSRLALRAGVTVPLLLPPGTGTAVDVEMSLQIPPATEAAALSFDLTVFAPPAPAADIDPGFTVQLQLSPPAQNGTRTATVGQKSFPVLPAEALLHVRALVDRSIVEVFFGRGRATVTQRLFPAANAAGVRVRASVNATLRDVAVHEMACGWVDA